MISHSCFHNDMWTYTCILYIYILFIYIYMCVCMYIQLYIYTIYIKYIYIHFTHTYIYIQIRIIQIYSWYNTYVDAKNEGFLKWRGTPNHPLGIPHFRTPPKMFRVETSWNCQSDQSAVVAVAIEKVNSTPATPRVCRWEIRATAQRCDAHR
jgi:hypothetical protein